MNKLESESLASKVFKANTQVGGEAALQNTAYMEDIKTVQKVRDGDIGAFEIIMRRYNQRLFRAARSILKNDADAEDALQEAYIKTYLKLDQYTNEGSFAGWLTRIVVNEALARRRKASAKSGRFIVNNISASAPEVELMSDDAMILPDQLAHSSALRRLIESAVDSLPDEFRTVFVLRSIEQMSIQETADALGLEANTVKTRQHRAVKKLREKLDDAYKQQIKNSFGFDGERCDRIVEQTLLKINGQAV